MTYKKIFTLIYICFVFFTFSSCTSVKNALTGKKNETSDEFLIKKKNPLVLPPDYDDLPEPKDASIEEMEEDDTDIEKLIGTYEDEEDQDDNSSDTIEKFVLENINKD